MTDIAITTRKTPIADAVRKAFGRLKDWLNEEVSSDPVSDPLTMHDWADLPVHHPAATRDDRDAR
jgi:hypothetical protein